MSTRRFGRPGDGRIARVSPFELWYLRLKTPDWPGHFGGLAVLEGKALLDASGQLRIEAIRDRLNRRVAGVRRLRQRVLVPSPLGGRPLWVDDERFAIEHHVRQSAVRPPGGEAELLEAAAEVYGRLLDQTRPLWELWFLTGLEDGRVGALLKLHHAVADGTAAVAVMASLCDISADAPDPALTSWAPEPAPGGWSLLADNLVGKARAISRGVAALAHPRRLVEGVRVLALVAKRSIGMKGAPRTSLNGRVRAGRRIGLLRLDLGAVKDTVHARGGKVNDLALTLWAGGLRELLVSRGEPVVGVEPTVGIAVSLRPTADGTTNNQVGTVMFPLPAWEGDVGRRLELVIRTTREIKARQRPAAIMGALVGLMASPAGRWMTLHQRAASVLATNVVGPPVPIYLLGARIVDILPIIILEGNVGLTLCAFSYAGRLLLAVTADAGGFPDLEVLMRGMERDWRALAGGSASEMAGGDSATI